MPIAGLIQAPTVKVDGSALSTQLFETLIEARVELSYGAAGWFRLRFDGSAGRHPSLKVGAAVAIEFDDADGRSVEVFTGTIGSLAMDFDLGVHQLVVSGYDHRNKVRPDRNVRTFANQSYADVLQKIASEAGLSARIDGALRSPRHVHIVQTESDIEFVSAIARATGMEWYVEGTTLIVGPRTSSTTVELEGGKDLRRFSARYTAQEHPSATEVHGWDPREKKTIVGSDTSSMKSPSSSVPIEQRSRPTANRKAITWIGSVGSADEAKASATAIARRMTAAALTGRGEAIGTPAIVPGVTCQITGLGDDWNGSYFVTTAEHLYGRGDTYLTRFTVGSSESTGLLDVLGPRAAQVSGGLTSGVTVGIVTNDHDRNGDHPNHVKVKFPYLGDDIESAWARVAASGAGAKRGMIFMPEVGDEVVVAFEHGDIRRPYVIGGLWNGKDALPLSRSDAEVRAKRSIVSKAGHTLTFYDGSGDDKNNVTIEIAGSTTKIHLGKDKVEVIAGDGKPLELKNDKARVVLAGNGDITISGEKITIDAKKDLAVNGMNVKIASQQKTSVAANTQLEMKSNAPAKLESTAILELKGTMVKVN